MTNEYIKGQMVLKNSHVPYQATSSMCKKTVTDYDTWPYPRWYRGEPDSDKPIIAEREAGWRQRHDNCYTFNPPINTTPNQYPNHCWQGASNTIVPCYPEYLARYADKNLIDSLLNKACIVQYR